MAFIKKHISDLPFKENIEDKSCFFTIKKVYMLCILYASIPVKGLLGNWVRLNVELLSLICLTTNLKMVTIAWSWKLGDKQRNTVSLVLPLDIPVSFCLMTAKHGSLVSNIQGMYSDTNHRNILSLVLQIALFSEPFECTTNFWFSKPYRFSQSDLLLLSNYKYGENEKECSTARRLGEYRSRC